MRDAWLLGCVFSAVLARSAPLHADDWLAVLPACSEPAPSAASLELVYPNQDLPAVSTAGDALVVRVRVPAALTPPPGVQQERALSGWYAELIGDGLVLASAALAHRHSLPVISVRPDTGSSLVYRVRLAVPAYAAPGSYALSLRTPFGDRRAERAVRVIEPGALPRMAAVPAGGLHGHGLASLPVDVWIDVVGAADGSRPEVAEPGLAAQPRLALGARALALRVGSQLWVSAPCVGDGSDFEAEVLDVLRSEQRVRVALSTAASAPLTAAPIRPHELVAVRWQAGAAGLYFDNRGSQLERQLLLLLPASGSVRASHAELALYPAGDLLPRRLSAIAAQLRIPPGVEARVELGPAAPSGSLTLEPELTESGRPTTLRVLGAAADARVAFDYGFARTALAGPTLRVSFAGPLEQPLRALVLTRAAGGQLVRGRLSVTPHRPPSCAAGRVPGRTGRAPWPLFALGFLLKRRSRCGFGNRVPPARRCQLRDPASHAKNTA
jgi:hypothetical protein